MKSKLIGAESNKDFTAHTLGYLTGGRGEVWLSGSRGRYYVLTNRYDTAYTYSTYTSKTMAIKTIRQLRRERGEK